MTPEIIQLQSHQMKEALAPLIDLLIDSVNNGASVGFMPPLSMARATDYWQEVFNSVAAGTRLLWVTSDDRGICGTVQVDLCQRENGLHRAEIAKLLVHTRVRRQGLGAALMAAAQEGAREHARTTLVLDTRLGDPSEQLYTKIGYQRAGVIPQYALSAGNELHSTVLFYKLLPPIAPTST